MTDGKFDDVADDLDDLAGDVEDLQGDVDDRKGDAGGINAGKLKKVERALDEAKDAIDDIADEDSN
jgi:hypothetical protein